MGALKAYLHSQQAVGAARVSISRSTVRRPMAVPLAEDLAFGSFE
jgi:hypothetical protein